MVEVNRLPCPFCGSSDIRNRHDYEDGIFKPECRVCGGSCGTSGMKEHEIKARWNTRHLATSSSPRVVNYSGGETFTISADEAVCAPHGFIKDGDTISFKVDGVQTTFIPKMIDGVLSLELPASLLVVVSHDAFAAVFGGRARK